MKNFEIVILAGPKYVVTRAGKENREFNSIKGALDYAAKLPGGTDATKWVTNDQGKQMRVVW